jgi:hypothetical protein
MAAARPVVKHHARLWSMMRAIRKHMPRLMIAGKELCFTTADFGQIELIRIYSYTFDITRMYHSAGNRSGTCNARTAYHGRLLLLALASSVPEGNQRQKL